jgi:hypothetical protein
MGDEILLLYHAGFQHICVTAAPTMPQTSHGNSLEHMSWEPGKITTITLTTALRQQISAMQRAHDQTTAPANIAKTILDELQGFNPFNTLKYSFWYFIGIVLLIICCFCLLSVRTQKIKRRLLGLNRNALGAFKK